MTIETCTRNPERQEKGLCNDDVMNTQARVIMEVLNSQVIFVTILFPDSSQLLPTEGRGESAGTVHFIMWVTSKVDTT